VTWNNIRIERFWRSLKYEEVFLNEYNSVREAKSAIGSYIDFYNHERLHQSLGYYTPHEVYYGIEKVNNKDFLAPSAQGAPFARSSLRSHPVRDSAVILDCFNHPTAPQGEVKGGGGDYIL